jgi:hypothetical protein
MDPPWVILARLSAARHRESDTAIDPVNGRRLSGRTRYGGAARRINPDKAKPVGSTGFAIASGVKRTRGWYCQDANETMAVMYMLASIIETVRTAIAMILRHHIGRRLPGSPGWESRFQAEPFLL